MAELSRADSVSMETGQDYPYRTPHDGIWHHVERPHAQNDASQRSRVNVPWIFQPLRGTFGRPSSSFLVRGSQGASRVGTGL